MAFLWMGLEGRSGETGETAVKPSESEENKQQNSTHLRQRVRGLISHHMQALGSTQAIGTYREIRLISQPL